MSRKLYNSQEADSRGLLMGVSRRTLIRMAANLNLLSTKEAHNLSTFELRDFINKQRNK